MSETYPEQQPDPSAFALTPAEVAEFRRLQKEAADKASQDREALRSAAQERTGPTHHVHLASGEFVKMAGGNLATHYNGIPVVAAYDMSEEDKAAARAEELAALES